MKRIRLPLLVGVPVLCVVACIAGTLIRLMLMSSYIEGRVIDSASGEPLAGVTVAVSNRGWGFHDDELVWDKDHIYPTTSDSTGQFRIVYKVGSSAHVIATADGYDTYDGWHDSNTSITIHLKHLSK